jgi:hypothetical protein
MPPRSSRNQQRRKRIRTGATRSVYLSTGTVELVDALQKELGSNFSFTLDRLLAFLLARNRRSASKLAESIRAHEEQAA